MNLEKLKAEYEKLRKKYNLPNFEEIDNEFEIRAIDLDKHGILIKAILRTILNKFGIFLNYLDPVINATGPSLHSMIEQQNLSEETKKEMLDFYKVLSYNYHKICEIELEDERTTAEFLKGLWREWPRLKKKEKEFLGKITSTWKKGEEAALKNTDYTG